MNNQIEIHNKNEFKNELKKRSMTRRMLGWI